VIFPREYYLLRWSREGYFLNVAFFRKYLKIACKPQSVLSETFHKQFEVCQIPMDSNAKQTECNCALSCRYELPQNSFERAAVPAREKFTLLSGILIQYSDVQGLTCVSIPRINQQNFFLRWYIAQRVHVWFN
jgi:hypothetical protein